LQVTIVSDTIRATEDKAILLFTMDGSVDSIREALLNGNALYLDKRTGVSGIFEHVETFVTLSRGNATVQEVHLCIPATDPDDDVSGTHRYAIWETVAEGIGNLQALHHISICESHDDEGSTLAPDWEILACILRRLRRGIQLNMAYDTLPWVRVRHPEALPGFVGVIRGHTMITGFCTGSGFPFHCLDMLCSALLTLPALDRIEFETLAGEGPEEGQSLDSVVQLLQSSALRHVEFYSISFSNSLSQAVAKALKERSEITELHFDGCSFPEGGGAMIASGLTTNTTLKCLEFGDSSQFDKGFYEDLIPVLKKNYGLEELPGLHHGAGDIRSILQLNAAGRRYLVQDGSSISKGVDVLSGVSNDINSLFLHLLENPRLCNRSAVEMSSISDVRSTSPRTSG
jgi:hypothetical protein